MALKQNLIPGVGSKSAWLIGVGLLFASPITVVSAQETLVPLRTPNTNSPGVLPPLSSNAPVTATQNVEVLSPRAIPPASATPLPPATIPPSSNAVPRNPEDLNKDPLFQEIKAAIMNSPNAPKNLTLEPIREGDAKQGDAPKRLAQPKLVQPKNGNQRALKSKAIVEKKANAKWEAAELVLRAARLLEEQSQSHRSTPEEVAHTDATIEALRRQAVEILNGK